jgi:RNA polymerase primary sigma factor
MVEATNKVFRTARLLVQQHGREPTPAEIATHMETPLDEVLTVFKLVREPDLMMRPRTMAGRPALCRQERFRPRNHAD